MLTIKMVYENEIDFDKLDLSAFSFYRQQKIFASRNPETRKNSISASLALKLALDELGYEEQRTEYFENEFGKPFFANIPNLYFSLSHTKGLSVCVISDIPVGVDCERADREISDRVLNKFFSESEIKAYDKSPIALWTAKEAYSKLKGLPFAECADNIEIPFFENETELKDVSFKKNIINGFIISVAQII